jgi:hypothetical protein
MQNYNFLYLGGFFLSFPVSVSGSLCYEVTYSTKLNDNYGRDVKLALNALILILILILETETTHLRVTWIWMRGECDECNGFCEFYLYTDKGKLNHLSGSLINGQNDQGSWVQYRTIIKIPMTLLGSNRGPSDYEALYHCVTHSQLLTIALVGKVVVNECKNNLNMKNILKLFNQKTNNCKLHF